MADLAFIQKEIELRQNLAGNQFITPDPKGAKIYIMGELTTAKNFQEDNIYIFLETRLPSDEWEFNTEDYEDPRIQPEDQSDLINRIRSITQTSRSIPAGQARKPIAHFSFPLALSLRASTNALLSEWPKVCIQVNSVDSWGKHKILGYGFLELPPQPGYHQISVQTCRPVEDLYSEVHSFYLGGGVRLEDPWEMSKSFALNEIGVKAEVNRYGYRSESGGKVNFQMSVVIQTQAELLKQVEMVEAINRKQKKELKWKREHRKKQQIIGREAEKRTIAKYD